MFNFSKKSGVFQERAHRPKRLLWPSAALICFWAVSTFGQNSANLTPANEGSKVCFTIRNFGVKTNGEFSGLTGTIRFEAHHPERSQVDVSVRAFSVNTANSTRDKHLRQKDYFDAEKYPEIRIYSSSIQVNKPGKFLFNGNVIIKGISRPLKFFFTVSQWKGGYVFQCEQFQLNRRDFDVGSNSLTLSDDVYVRLSVYARP